MPLDDGRRGVAIWLLVTILILPIAFSIGPLAMTGLRAMLLITIIPTTIGLFSGRYGRTYPIDYLLILHTLWTILCLSINNPNQVVEHSGSYFLELFGTYVLARALIRTPQDFYQLIRAIMFFTVLSLPFAIIESRTDVAPIIRFIDSIPGLSSVVQVDMPQRLGLFRSQVTLAHPIHYGLFCTGVLSLTWIGMKGVMNGTLRILSVLAIVAAVFFSLSSGALLPAAMQGGLILWNFVFRNNPKRWLLLLGLCALAYVVVDLLSNRTPLRVFMSYATFSPHNAFYRAVIFDWGMINVWNNPIFGLGLRSWIRPGWMGQGSIDNYWLVMAIRYGIPGFLLIAACFVDAVFRIGRRKLSPGSPTSNLRLAWMFTFVSLGFTLSTVHIWGAAFTYVFFLLGAGMWMASASDAPEAVAAAAPGSGAQSKLSWSRPLSEASNPEASHRADNGSGFVRKPAEPKPDERGRRPRYTRFEDRLGDGSRNEGGGDGAA